MQSCAPGEQATDFRHAPQEQPGARGGEQSGRAAGQSFIGRDEQVLGGTGSAGRRNLVERGRIFDGKHSRAVTSQRSQVRPATERFADITRQAADVRTAPAADVEPQQSARWEGQGQTHDLDLASREFEGVSRTGAGVRTLSVDLDGAVRRRHLQLAPCEPHGGRGEECIVDRRDRTGPP